MKEVRFDRMATPDVVERREACNLAYLPVGSLEWHGPHMPFGTDYMTVAWLAEEAAKRFGGVAFPPIYYGDVRYILQECRPEWRNTYTRDMHVPEEYASAFGLEHHTQREEIAPPQDDGIPPEAPLGLGIEECEAFFAELIARTLLAVHLYGFRNIILLPGHGPNPQFCKRAEEIYRQNVLRRQAFGRPAKTMTWFYIEAAKETEPLLKNHWVHADKWEGSFTMIAAPGTVHPERLPKDPKTLVPAYLGEPYLNETHGYNPEYKHIWHSFDALDPRRGMSEDYGKKQVEGVLDAFGRQIAEFMGNEEGGSP
ncbi:creatininase family protein [Verrucomicrobiota bacterium]